MELSVAERAKAKINLALHVTGRRDDGYHVLDSVVAFAECADQLTFTRSDRLQLVVVGPFGADVPVGDDNIVMKAARKLEILLASRGVALPPTTVMLEKNLPVASGIGGGSADAAATLRGLCRLARVDVPHAQLWALALSLGADVPVCLAQSSCRMQGIGEIITPVSDIGAMAIVLVNPLVSLSTKAVFDRLALTTGQSFSQPLEMQNKASWRNDLQVPACALCPEITDVLDTLCQYTDFKATGMSGSGATCFGMSESIDAANAIAKSVSAMHPGWWVKGGQLG